MHAVTLHRLTVRYGDHPAIAGISGTIGHGALTAIAGPNGAGKSTLLRSIAGLSSLDEGRICLSGLGSRDVAYLPQKADLESSFPIAVRDVVAAGLWHRYGAFGCMAADAAAEIARALGSLGLQGFETRMIASLSAGQLQRVLFARLILQDAKLILLDEPFNAIDARTIADLMDVIRRWHGERRTILCALHDLDQIRTHFPTTLLLARTVVAWGPSGVALSPANLLRARAQLDVWHPRIPLSRAWA